jgi:U3 small nucleolar RNA-associated protein 12
MVKAYFRYEPAAAFGVIVSGEANIVYDSSGKHLLAPALEKVGVWHVRQGLCTNTLAPSPASRGPSLAVTSIASSPSSSLVEAFFLFFFVFPWYWLGCRESEATKTQEK